MVSCASRGKPFHNFHEAQGRRDAFLGHSSFLRLYVVTIHFLTVRYSTLSDRGCKEVFSGWREIFAPMKHVETSLEVRTAIGYTNGSNGGRSPYLIDPLILNYMGRMR